MTAGNPLLLASCWRPRRRARRPDAAHAAAVRAIGPRAVARTVLLRLARLPAPAVAVARAVAVLGEQPGLPAVAALAGVDEPRPPRRPSRRSRGRRSCALTSRWASSIRSIRDAVYGELTGAGARRSSTPARRGCWPSSARAPSASPPSCCSPRRGAIRGWSTRCARPPTSALRRGAPDAAMRLLERAQAEPPPRDQQAALALELGGSAAYLRGPAGGRAAAPAYAELTDPAERGRAGDPAQPPAAVRPLARRGRRRWPSRAAEELPGGLR